MHNFTTSTVAHSHEDSSTLLITELNLSIFPLILLTLAAVLCRLSIVLLSLRVIFLGSPLLFINVLLYRRSVSVVPGSRSGWIRVV